MTTYTTNLGLALPVTGDLTGTWGDTVNNAITSLLDSAVAGTTTLSSDADVTLTDTTGAANQARQAIILWTAGGTVTRNITAPARTKAYVVINATSSTQSIVLRGAGPTTGVTVVAGERCLVAWNGTDFVKVGSTVFSGTLGVANGGTGATSLTLNNVLLGNGTSAVQVVAPGANGNVLTSNGTTWASAAPVTGLPSQTGNAGKWLTTDGTNPSWQTLIAPGGGGSIAINTTTVTANYTIAAGTNGFSVGPITVDSGVAVTVASGQRWVVV